MALGDSLASSSGNYGTALNGSVPGQTWANFTQNFAAPTSAGQWSGSGNVNGLGYVGADRNASHTLGSSGGEMGSGDPNNPFGTFSGDWSNYTQATDPTHQNTYSQGPDGGVVSHNDTVNTDSWWDKNLGPILFSIAGGAAGLSGALGAAGDAGLAAGQGAVNVGAGFAPSGLDAATTLGSSLGAVGAGGSAATNGVINNASMGSGFAPGEGGLMNVGADVAPEAAAGSGEAAAAPSTWQSLTNAWNGVNPLVKTLIGTLGSAAFRGSGGESSDSANPFPSIVQNYSNNSTPVDYSSAGGDPIQYNSAGQPTQGAIGSGISSTAPSSNFLSSALGAVKDYTGLSGNQLLNGATSLTSALLGSNAAKTAAGQQTSAINNANALTASIYGDTVNRNAPFVQAGTGATNILGNLYGLNGGAAQTKAYGDFQTSPNYQFAFDQGNRAVQSSASAAGGLYSGKAAKDLMDYGQRLASQQFNSYTGGLSSLANLGQNSANNTGAQGASYASQAAGLTTAGGIAQSAGTMGSANAITNALSQFLKYQSQSGYYGP